MTLSFAPDPLPGKPRILFIGASESTHTHAWINLIEGEQFNVQLFGIPGTAPPDSWPVRTYVTLYDGLVLDPATRKRLYPANRLARFMKWRLPRAGRERSVRGDAKFWLARIIRKWQPDI